MAGFVSVSGSSSALCFNWIIQHHHWPLTFCISLVTQETKTQLLLCPGGAEWSQAASSSGALWGRLPAALCPGERGHCEDPQPSPGADQGAFPGHPQAGAEWPKGMDEPGRCYRAKKRKTAAGSHNGLHLCKRGGRLSSQAKPNIGNGVCSPLLYNYSEQAALHQM